MTEHVVAARCGKCKSTEFVDTRLYNHDHAGKSVRRDCRKCGWTFGFPEWYGQTSPIEDQKSDD